MENKKFYWIKLKNTFMTSDTVDFLMSQKNGANYVVLYQMLCLKTINTNGELARKIGEIIIPYDAEKIQRDCKYFDIDTIRVALGLYQQLGLIYQQEDNILRITNFENLIGGETPVAQRVRECRARKDEEKRALQCNTLCNKNVTIEKENKSIEKDIKESTTSSTKEKAIRFSPPSLEEVQDYCSERKNKVDCQRFIDFYTSKDWYIGKNKMKDWKASIRTWEAKDNEKNQCTENYIKHNYSEEQINNVLSAFENWEG